MSDHIQDPSRFRSDDRERADYWKDGLSDYKPSKRDGRESVPPDDTQPTSTIVETGMTRRNALKQLLFIPALLLTVAASASAQAVVTNPDATRLGWDHDGVGIDAALEGGFRIYVMDQAMATESTVAIPSPAPTGPAVDGLLPYEAPFPSMTIGVHNLAVTAYNMFAESAKSDIIQVRLIVISTPRNFRLVAGLLPLPIHTKGNALVLGYQTRNGVWHHTFERVKIG